MWVVPLGWATQVCRPICRFPRLGNGCIARPPFRVGHALRLGETSVSSHMPLPRLGNGFFSISSCSKVNLAACCFRAVVHWTHPNQHAAHPSSHRPHSESVQRQAIGQSMPVSVKIFKHRARCLLLKAKFAWAYKAPSETPLGVGLRFRRRRRRHI